MDLVSMRNLEPNRHQCVPNSQSCFDSGVKTLIVCGSLGDIISCSDYFSILLLALRDKYYLIKHPDKEPSLTSVDRVINVSDSIKVLL